EIALFKRALLEFDVPCDHLVAIYTPLPLSIIARDFHHLELAVTKLVRCKETAVWPSERDPGERRLGLQLREKDELALIRFARVDDVLHEDRVDRAVGRFGAGNQRRQLPFHRAHNLLIDGPGKYAAVALRGAPPKEMNKSGGDHDGAKDEDRECKTNTDPHCRPRTRGVPRIL